MLAYLGGNAVATTWATLLDQYAAGDERCMVLQRQHAYYATHGVLEIVDERVRKVDVCETDELFVDLIELKHPRIHMVKRDADSTEKYFRYAHLVRASLLSALGQTLSHLDELAPRFGIKAGVLEIEVIEGLRDIGLQHLYFMARMMRYMAQDPLLSREDAWSKTARLTSPVDGNIPPHTTGGAIALRLFDREANDYLDCGFYGPRPDGKSNEEKETFIESLTEQQKKNRLLLLIATARAGLVNYPQLWWHYSLGDRYAAYWQGKATAEFGICQPDEQPYQIADIPSILVGDIIELRRLCREDIPALVQLCSPATRELIAQGRTNAQLTQSLEASLSNEHLAFSIYDKAHQQLIGFIAIHPFGCQGNLCFWLAEQHRREGNAREAFQLITAIYFKLFPQRRYYSAFMRADNCYCMRLAQGIGFVRPGQQFHVRGREDAWELLLYFRP